MLGAILASVYSRSTRINRPTGLITVLLKIAIPHRLKKGKENETYADETEAGFGTT